LGKPLLHTVTLCSACRVAAAAQPQSIVPLLSVINHKQIAILQTTKIVPLELSS